MDNKAIGKLGEDIVCSYLKKKGYTLLQRNYFVRQGEIDIVFEKKSKLYFVEVKTRKSLKYGLPGEAVNISKQRKIVRAALSYLQENKVFNKQYQFDVVEVYLSEEGFLQKLNHIENAFIF